MERKVLLERYYDVTRMAVLEDGVLCELYEERDGDRPLAGNIYLGRIMNVASGIDAVFVDIGEERNALLPLSDVKAHRPEKKPVRPGDEILLQVVKEPGGEKGCSCTTGITLPGRLSVILPGTNHRGVSQKITDETERERLRAAVDEIPFEDEIGMIVRTAGEGASAEELMRDYRALTARWTGIARQARIATAPKKLYDAGGIPQRLARNWLGSCEESIEVDQEPLYREVLEELSHWGKDPGGSIALWPGETSLFDAHRVDHQLEKALKRQIWLKSGATLFIDETEALTVIDVNSAKSPQRETPEKTIVRVNCEAAVEIARQLRLRDIGGIVIIDFIDMQQPESRKEVTDTLKNALQRDPNRTAIVGFTELGLLQMTRKNVRVPYKKRMERRCPACDGTGAVLRPEVVASGAARELWLKRRAGERGKMKAIVTKEVADALAGIIDSKDSLNIIVDTHRRHGDWKLTSDEQV